MPNKTLWPPTKQVRGYTPALDRRQIPEPSVVDGKNFLIDAEGPYSAFGTRIPTYARLLDTALAASFRVSGEQFYFVDNGVLQYDYTTALFYPVLVFASPSSDIFPWSHALVGGKHYFAKKGHDLIQYDPIARTWTELTTDVPPNPVAVTNSNDRLIVLGSDRVARSAISDGSDLTTSTVTGAGFQLLALIGGGDPLGVKRIPTGFLVFTTEGIMLAEAIDAVVPFRHRALDHDYRPISPFAIVEIEHVVVYMSKQGLYQTRGQIPQPFEEIMSEYFRRQVLNQIDLDDYGVIKLHYDSDRQWLIISQSGTEQPFKFSIAFVLYMPIRQWGIFSREHTNFIEILLTDGIDEGFNFGYLNEDGYFFKFTEDPFAETAPPSTYQYLYYSDILSEVTRIENGVYIAASSMVMFDMDLSKIQKGNGLYIHANEADFVPVYSDLSTELAPMESTDADPIIAKSLMNMGSGVAMLRPSLWPRMQGSIDSYITVGTYRMSEQQKSDELSLVTQVMIGTDELSVNAASEDWLTISPNIMEDWLNDDLIAEDWGSGVASGADFDVELLSTLDGEYQFNYPPEELTEYHEAQKSRYYPANREGIYHLVTLRAQQESQSFHLKLQELSGMIVGNL